MLERLLGRLQRLTNRSTAQPNAWKRSVVTPRLDEFGPGARHEFDHYLAGESTVAVSTLEDVQQWLLGCAYVSDEALFHEDDVWQHPSAFEQRRAGDCEDFALWAWRKLCELGVDAEFVVGACSSRGSEPVRHAWLVIRVDEVEYLFEPAAAERERMVMPLSVVRECYVPHVGVDRRAQRFSFRGNHGRNPWGQ